LGAAATWEALTAGRVGIRALTEEQDNIPPALLKQLPCRVAAALPSRPQAPPGLEGAWSRGQLSPFIQYALVAAEEAVGSSGWRGAEADADKGERAGCFIGTGIGCLDAIMGADKTLKDDGVRRLSPHFVPQILGNLATGQVSIRHGLKGPNHACVTACASGAHAVGDAFRLIQRGEADVMVCGGSEACIGPLALAGFSRLRALSTGFNDAPLHASRPFDATRDGFVMGEGSAVLVL
jgi:3-oxoacyl-[acyl-carrier-protein] synthase II